jgi:hypothetical protein
MPFHRMGPIGVSSILLMPTAPRLCARDRRSVLEQLPRDRLGELIARFELDVEDRRAIDAQIEPLIRKCSPDSALVLDALKRDGLQAACVALGLDPGGREKAKLVDAVKAGR